MPGTSGWPGSPQHSPIPHLHRHRQGKVLSQLSHMHAPASATCVEYPWGGSSSFILHQVGADPLSCNSPPPDALPRSFFPVLAQSAQLCDWMQLWRRGGAALLSALLSPPPRFWVLFFLYSVQWAPPFTSLTDLCYYRWSSFRQPNGTAKLLIPMSKVCRRNRMPAAQ